MSTPLRILLVEDSENDAELALLAMRRGGYEPSSLRVETADALASALESEPWDIVLCDYSLPHYSGADALTLLRARKPDLPVIIVTGTIGEEQAVSVIKAGACDYVMKDRLTRLPVAVNQAIREAGERRMRRETQQTLRDTALQLRGVLEAATDAVFEIDATGRIMLANQAAHRLFGWLAGALFDQNITVIVPPEQRERHQAGLQRFLNTGDGPFIGKVTEVSGCRQDGTLFPCELSVAALTHQDQSARFVGIVRDITERKAMETQARRLEQMAAMGQLLGGISHELKNPLFVLTGRLQLLKEKLACREYDGLGPDLQKIEDAAQRMTGVAQRFLALARPTKPMLQRCVVQEVLLAVLDFLSNELMKHRIRVIREWEPALSKTQIWSDPQALHQIFLNLMLNAMQAMAQAHGQGILTVATTIANGWIEVRIQDDGPGIPPEHKAKLFEPFFTTKPVGAGTGLGLWTVRVALKDLKGQVTFETEVGRGTTFVVRLPMEHKLDTIADKGASGAA